MGETLLKLGQRIYVNADEAAKPLKVYEIYDRYFGDFFGRNVTLLELGVLRLQ